MPQDEAAELKALRQLNEDVDQAAATARDCDTLCPEAKTLLDLAWWFTEDAIREATGKCSAGCKNWPAAANVLRRICGCCAHYDELKHQASSIKGRL